LLSFTPEDIFETGTMLLVLDNFDVYTTIGLSLRELRYGAGAVEENRGSDVRD